MAKEIAGKPFRREIELDFVRGLAILMVLDFHMVDGPLSWPFRALGFPAFGWMGVDVFFVLSGFLVGGLLVKEWGVRGRIDSKQFLIRRGFKIWPQYYIFILIDLFSGHRSFHRIWGNLLNIQNYVGGVAHTWSLAVEEHAYLFLVLCLAIASRARVRMRHLFLFIAGLALAVSLLRLLLTRYGVNHFGTTHTRIDGILEGVLLAILYHYAPEIFHRLQSWWWIWLGSVAAVLLFDRFLPNTWWMPSIADDMANLLGVAMMLLLYRHREGKRHNFVYRFVAWIGLYSYGIYLWHVSVAEPLSELTGHLPHWLQATWLGLAPMVAGVVVGIIATKVVELPALRLRDRWFPRRVDSAVGIPAEIEVAEHTVQEA